MKGVYTKPLSPDDVRALDRWRRLYAAADLELPHDFNASGVKTVGLHKDFRLFGSLTGAVAVVLDPFIHDPAAHAAPTGGRDIIFGLVKADAVLTHWGQEHGAVDAYIAIPQQLSHYIRLLEGYGYRVTCQNCVVMRRPLTPETVPLIGPERDGTQGE